MISSQIILIIAVTAALTAIITTIMISGRLRRKVTYMLDALEDKELNFRFDEKRMIGRGFNRTLNRLKNIFDNERREIIEQEKYFGQMPPAEEMGMLRFGKQLNKGGLFKLNTDQNAIAAPQLVGGVRIDGDHILRTELIAFIFHHHGAAAAEDQVDLEIIVLVGFDIADLVQHASQGHKGLEIGNLIVLAHGYPPPDNWIIG